MRFSWPNQEHSLLRPGTIYYADGATYFCKMFVPYCQTACVTSQIIILIFSAINVKHDHYSKEVMIVFVTSKRNIHMFLVPFTTNLCAKYALRLRAHKILTLLQFLPDMYA